MNALPFVIGQWVSGSRFYGRAALLAALAPAGPHRAWVVGLRRAGKTSLLKQLEHLALAGPAPVLPLFWDLQGVDGPRELALSFADALLEAEEQLAPLGLCPAELAEGEVFGALATLASALARRGGELLLLLDEAEELVALERTAPGTVDRLWQALAAPSARLVLASSPRLAELAASDPAAAWLAELEGPFLLGPLAPAEARALLRQDQSPPSARPGFEAAAIEALRSACGDHPMLLQMLGKRCSELGDAARAIAALEAERTVDHLFAVDVALLAAPERELLAELARGAAAPADDPRAPRLLALGLLRGGARLALASRLFAAWLARWAPAAEPQPNLSRP